MKEKRLALLNTASVILVLVVNYYSQAFGINGNTVGSLSNRYENLFTPASYAFSIWGIIFLMMLVYAVRQLWLAFGRSKNIEGILKTGYLFAIGNALNASWVVVWLYEWTAVSVMVMVGLLLCLIQILMKVVNTSSNPTWKQRIMEQWPVTIYAGWITVATVANMSAFLAKLNWTGGPFSELQWTLLMISIAIVVNVLVIWKWRISSFALVGAWALYAISVRHESNYVDISQLAFSGAVILLVGAVLQSILSMINRRTLASSL